MKEEDDRFRDPLGAPQGIMSEEPSSRLDEGDYERLRELEGECLIFQWGCMEVNYPKAIFFSILLTLTVVGLFFLKHYKALRAYLLYSSLSPKRIQQATHVYVEGTDHKEICTLEHLKVNNSVKHIFEFKHLKYEVLKGKPVPLSFHYWQELQYCLKEEFLRAGLSGEESKRREHYLGRNEHLVQVPGYFQFIFDTMTKPFFIFQYLMSTVFILESVATFGVLLIFFSWLTTTINYFLLRRSYQQIKSTAEKEFPVTVLRDGRFQTVSNTDLVPGDLYVPGEEAPCDSIVLQGELFVDEAGLTGENIPIGKFRLRDIQEIQASCHWIFEGSKIQTMKEDTFAIAVHTGYCSRRGRIIRKILTKEPKQPLLFKKLIYFMTEVLIVTVVVYLLTLGHLLSTNIETSMVIFRFFDFISNAFPPPYPIYFNLAYSFCLVRLQREDILGTECQKTVQGGHLKTLCFDKTGTLTHPAMHIKHIFHINAKNCLQQAPSDLHPLITALFACCHSVELIHGQPKGDEIDLQMFLRSGGRIQPICTGEVIRNIVLPDDEKWQILKIHQYESRFQSMSVVVREVSSGKSYVFSKGSPEMIHNFSSQHYQHYDQFIKRLSLEGFRSIAFGHTSIRHEDLKSFLSLDRDQVMQKMDMLGVVTFVNQLKEDARSTVRALSQAQIHTKIITGDNIFLGIQTAILSGMLPQNSRVGVLEGRHYDGSTKEMKVRYLSRSEGGEFEESQEKVSSFSFQNEDNLYYAVDNDFLKKLGSDCLHHKIKVFARITPENKALIVRKHKELYQLELDRSGKFFGDCGFKVGMVGDGANDLIAIKEADVGIGIRASDAVYSASFAVTRLEQILEILREGKNTERQLIEIVQYYGICSMLNVAQTLVLTGDQTYPTNTMLLYRTYCNYLIVTLFLGLSRPADTLTGYHPATNFMGLQHQLVHWGTTLLLSLGLVATYQYYSNSSDFQPNPKPYVTFKDGFNGICKSASMIFLCSNVVYTLLGPILYRSLPWKESLLGNKPLTITVAVNLALSIPMFFLTKHLSIIDLVEIGQKEAAICLIIILITMLTAGFYNRIIEKKAMHIREEAREAVKTEIFEEIKSNSQ